MVLIKNKKGIFFTTLVIILLSLFILTYTFYSEIKERKSVQKRIETMNNFLFSTEQDLQRQLYASGFRIIFLFEKRITEKGIYISNLNSTFEELFFNGTIYGETNNEIQTLMTGIKFSDIEDSIKAKLQKINVNINLFSPFILIRQEDPWRIKVSLISNLIMQDESNLALWNKTSIIDTFIPIENFEDPLYIISTNGVVTNKIIKSPYQNFVQGSDISNLFSHSKNSYYISSTSAPSFLDRLEGKNSPNENGIESLVNLEKLTSQAIQTKDKSVVDYIYFSNSNPAACNVQPAGMPSWFKLDDAHLAIYQVSCA